MHRMRRLTAAAVALATIALALTACGSGDGSSDDAGPTTYRNDEHGFIITYGSTFEEGVSREGNGGDRSPVFEIAFPAPEGATIDDKYVDGVRVSVYTLSRKLKPAEVRKLKDAFVEVVDGMLASLGDAEVTDTLKPMELNGVPGFNLGYTYRQGDTTIKSVAFYLVKDKREFHVTGQATLEDWDELAPELEAAIMSFTVL